MSFWIAAAVIFTIVAAFICWPLLSPRARNAEPDNSADKKVYRDQLVEVERDAARGLLGQDEAEQAKLEISRRLLAADQRANISASTGKTPAQPILAVVVVIGLASAAFGLYFSLGADGAADLPLEERIADLQRQQASRPTQEQVEAEIGDRKDFQSDLDPAYLDLVQTLRDTVADRPNDIQGLEFLATHEANLGNFRAAWRAKARALQLKGDDILAVDFVDLSELMIVAAGGYVSPKAEAVLAQGLELDPGAPRARYYSGLAFAQRGRPDLTYDIWRDLLQTGPSDAQWVQAIQVQLPEIARLIGKPEIESLPGPDASEIEDAQSLDAEARSEMINGMVARLEQRLSEEGGSAEEWARLMRALMVLDRVEEAQQAWKDGQLDLEQDAESRNFIDGIASDLGLVE